jgi:serine/threonine-protein kinase
MAEKAVDRLAWVALFYVLAFPVMRAFGFLKEPGFILRLSPFPLLDIALVGGVATGAIVCILAWRRKLPHELMLDIGLLFEVLGAFWIALAESGRPLSVDAPFHGVSSIALWITFFILVVPGTLGKTVLAAMGTAAMGPLGLLVVILFYGLQTPEPIRWVQIFAPNFMFAAFAVVLSRFIYSLARDARKAREMGSYKLVERLGAGGMGEVWKAEHRLLARPSAIKLIRSDICNRNDVQAGTLRRRFEREVQATAGLRSPHTVAVHDFGSTDDGCFYYVMELLEGLDLETIVERFGPQPPHRVIHFLLQICDSLAEAHSHGLIHRDVKPKNIFACRMGLNYDFIKVLDFGLVKSSSGADGVQSQLTIDGTTTGTPAYMSPEMALRDRAVDARTDIYSLGCVAYWLLTGQLVFEESAPLALLVAHIQTQPVPPSQRTELEISRDLDQVVLSCLEKDSARRPQTVQELARLLSSCRLKEAWTSGRAENWWRTHIPSLAARTETPLAIDLSSEPVLTR